MPEPTNLVLFLGAASVLLITPGPAVLFVVARSLEGGRAAGLVSTLGLGAGNLVHVAASVGGLSALLVSSAVAFHTVKLAGAAYLVFLGARSLFAPSSIRNRPRKRKRGFAETLREGFLVNVLNPKPALFFLAFLPQFVVGSESAAAQLLVLGLLFVGMGLVTDAAYALLAGWGGDRVDAKLAGAGRWVSGTVLLGLGVATALGSGEGD